MSKELQQLFELIETGTLEEVKKFFESNPIDNVNAKNNSQQTLLMVATRKGKYETVKFLLENLQCDLNLDDGSPNYKTALYYATQTKQLAIVKYLVQRKTLSEKDLNRALIYFAEIDDLENVKKCLEKEANINANYLGSTALMKAIIKGHDSVAKFLLSLPDINVNLYNNMHEHALLLSIIFERDEITSELLKRDDVDLRLQGYLAGTALTYAVFKDKHELVCQLISKERKKYQQLDISHHPQVLNWAVRNENKQLVQILLHAGADPNRSEDENPITRPDWVWRMDFDVMYPIDCEERNNLPLIWAVELQNEAIVSLLLEYKAELKTISAASSQFDFFSKRNNSLTNSSQTGKSTPPSMKLSKEEVKSVSEYSV